MPRSYCVRIQKPHGATSASKSTWSEEGDTMKDDHKTDDPKTAIVTGASSGIGLGITQTLLERGYRVVANSRNISKSESLTNSGNLVLVDGNIGGIAIATKVVDTAVRQFGRIDLLVNNAGLFISKPFTDYTA